MFIRIGNINPTVAACFLVPNSLSEVYVGLWSYNSLLTAGGISYFLAPTHHMFVAAIVGSVMSVVTQAAIMPIFLSVSQSNEYKGELRLTRVVENRATRQDMSWLIPALFYKQNKMYTY